MSKIKAPCYNCTKRNPQCHSNCEEYREYRRENNKRRAFLKNKKAENSLLNSTTINAVRRMQKKKEISEHGNYRKAK